MCVHSEWASSPGVEAHISVSLWAQNPVNPSLSWLPAYCLQATGTHFRMAQPCTPQGRLDQRAPDQAGEVPSLEFVIRG